MSFQSHKGIVCKPAQLMKGQLIRNSRKTKIVKIKGTDGHLCKQNYKCYKSGKPKKRSRQIPAGKQTSSV